MQQHGSKYIALRSSNPGVWVKRSHVACRQRYNKYQIKRNHECSNMTDNPIPADPLDPLTPPGDGFKRSKLNFFRTWSCCTFNQMESRMQQHGSKYYTHRPPALLRNVPCSTSVSPGDTSISLNSIVIVLGTF